MSFKLLKEVIAAFRKRSICPFCKGKFGDESIFVLATNLAGVGGPHNGLFFVVCPTCNATAFVMMELRDDESIKFETKSANGISTNDVLDMHNFLKEWRGDVKELFQEL